MARLGRTGVYQRFVPIHLEELADDTAPIGIDTPIQNPRLVVSLFVNSCVIETDIFAFVYGRVARLGFVAAVVIEQGNA